MRIFQLLIMMLCAFALSKPEQSYTANTTQRDINKTKNDWHSFRSTENIEIYHTAEIEPR